MKHLLLRALILLVLLVTGPAPADAHTRSESHSSWTVSGNDVTLVYSIPKIELRKLSENGALPSPAAQRAYVAKRLWVTAGGARCTLSSPPRSLSADDIFERVQLIFRCTPSRPMVLHARAFFDLVPSHMHFAQIQMASGDFVEQLFTRDDQSLDLSAGPGGALGSAGLATYVWLGIEHIFTGIDHMAFLLGLVLIARRLKDLLFVVTGFTIGHSITLALAVTGIVRPHAEYIDALVALTILLIGAENIAVTTRRPAAVGAGIVLLLAGIFFAEMFAAGGLPPSILLGSAIFAFCYLMFTARLSDAARVRLIVTLVFGLIHGFGFAAGLLEMTIPKDKLFELLLGFNMGVEIGQVSVVLLFVGAGAMLVRLRLALPKTATVSLVAALLACTGTYWLVGRSIIP